MSSVDVATGHGLFLDAVRGGRLRHGGKPELTAAARHATQRPLSGASTWQRRGSATDASPLLAATWALWALHRAPRPQQVFRELAVAERLDAIDVDPSTSDTHALAVNFDVAAARLGGVSRRTVERLAESGRLPTVDVGGCRRIAVADLAAFMDGLRGAACPDR